ncbi:hypothetical protein BD779DRAFT_1800025 [Infundibulicybe gibba]|nr:hypothetical protein BD779DRAFT_1800025 [Infundibulicybe gibba]
MKSSHPTPIPRNIVAYLGGVDIDTTSYALYKNGHVLVIQSEPIKMPTEGLSPADVLAKRDKEYNWRLEKIQSRLNSIDFSRISWAYLTPSRANGDYSIVPKARPRLPMPTCTTWAPLVKEEDIHITKWLSCEKRCGLWKGMDVDVFIELDITYDILAHVVDDLGQVIGIVREPAVGRAVEYGDRALVYKTITSVQQSRIVFRGLGSHNLLIKDGKLRVSDIGFVKHFREDEDEAMKEMAQLSHWRSLEIMFEDLQIQPSPPPLRTWKQNVCFFFESSDPERPRLLTVYIASMNSEVDEDENSSRRRNRNNRDRLSGARLPFFGVEFNIGPREVADGVDRPLLGTRLYSRRAQPNAFQPYRSRPASRKLLAAPEDLSEVHSPCAESIGDMSTGSISSAELDGPCISGRRKTTIPPRAVGVRTARSKA